MEKRRPIDLRCNEPDGNTGSLQAESNHSTDHHRDETKCQEDAGEHKR